jgi:Flp pilus assembly protein TadG
MEDFMISTPSRFNLVLRRFQKEEEGAVTVAAVLWVPFFVFVLTMVFDIAMIFYGQARAQEIAEDVNRSLSIGQYASFSDAEAAVKHSLNGLSPNAIAKTSSEDFMIRTVVRMPTSDLAPVGIFSSLTKFEVTAVAHMVQEF